MTEPLLKIKEPQVGVFQLEKKVDSEAEKHMPEVGLHDLVASPQQNGIQALGQQGGILRERMPEAEVGAHALVDQPTQIDGFEDLKRRRMAIA